MFRLLGQKKKQNEEQPAPENRKQEAEGRPQEGNRSSPGAPATPAQVGPGARQAGALRGSAGFQGLRTQGCPLTPEWDVQFRGPQPTLREAPLDWGLLQDPACPLPAGLSASRHGRFPSFVHLSARRKVQSPGLLVEAPRTVQPGSWWGRRAAVATGRWGTRQPLTSWVIQFRGRAGGCAAATGPGSHMSPWGSSSVSAIG